jgi:hypothetical protein
MESEFEPHLVEFRESGFTVFPRLFDTRDVEQWRLAFDGLATQSHSIGGGDSLWVRQLLERAPELALPAMTQPKLLRFAEQLIGPFVQTESVVMAGFPPEPAGEEGRVSAWHRDRLFGHQPIDGVYVRPHALIMMAYLEDLTDHRGPLRVIPGSHMQRQVVTSENKNQPHVRERLLHLRVGDAVVFHDHLLHSGTQNVADGYRHFIGVTYNLSWMKQEDAFDGPTCRRILQDARARGDRRLQRLLGEDEQMHRRLNSGPVQPSSEQWAGWAAEDDAALVRPATTYGL